MYAARGVRVMINKQGHGENATKQTNVACFRLFLEDVGRVFEGGLDIVGKCHSGRRYAYLHFEENERLTQQKVISWYLVYRTDKYKSLVKSIERQSAKRTFISFVMLARLD